MGYLWDINTLGRISAILSKGDNFYDFPFTFPHTKKIPSEKGFTLQGKNLLPRGGYSFLSEKATFQKGEKPF